MTPPESDKPYRIEEHSGDLRIVASGNDNLEALANASTALLSQIVDPDSVSATEQRPIRVSGDDETARIIGFLNELIYLVDAERWIPARVTRLATCGKSGCRALEAVLVGEPLDPGRHKLRYDVKAVTYHEFSIETGSDETTVTFICDL